MGAKDLDLVDALKPVGKAFAKDPDVVHCKATSLCVGKKVFAMIVNDQLVVKLSADRAAELVAAKKGRYHQLGARVMKEWFVSPAERKSEWVSVARESRKFVSQ